MRLGVALAGAITLALGLLGPTAAHTRVTPKYGGTLVVGLGGGDPTTLDPTTNPNGSSFRVFVIDSIDGTTAMARAMSGSFEAAVRALPGGNPDPHRTIYNYVATSGTANFSGYSNPRLDLILANGLKATEMKARSTLYRVAQQIIHDDRPIIYLYNSVTYTAFNANLAGVELSSNGVLLVANARFK